jgi:hypothetical protein
VPGIEPEPQTLKKVTGAESSFLCGIRNVKLERKILQITKDMAVYELKEIIQSSK